MMATFIPNPLLAREVKFARFTHDNLERIVTAGADLYREDVARNTGALEESVFSDVALTDEGWVGRWGAKDWKAALVELGTSRVPPNGALRRSAETLGIDDAEIGIGSPE